MPVSPAPANQIQDQVVGIEIVAKPIAAPEAAKPGKAGSAKGKGKDAAKGAIDSPKGCTGAKGKKPKAAAAKAKEPAVKGSKRKAKAETKTGR